MSSNISQLILNELQISVLPLSISESEQNSQEAQKGLQDHMHDYHGMATLDNMSDTSIGNLAGPTSLLTEESLQPLTKKVEEQGDKLLIDLYLSKLHEAPSFHQTPSTISDFGTESSMPTISYSNTESKVNRFNHWLPRAFDQSRPTTNFKTNGVE